MISRFTNRRISQNGFILPINLVEIEIGSSNLCKCLPGIGLLAADTQNAPNHTRPHTLKSGVAGIREDPAVRFCAVVRLPISLAFLTALV